MSTGAWMDGWTDGRGPNAFAVTAVLLLEGQSWMGLCHVLMSCDDVVWRDVMSTELPRRRASESKRTGDGEPSQTSAVFAAAGRL